MYAIPVDSTDAREQREAELEREAEDQAELARHDEQCVDGWLGDDDQARPIPCPRCRPALLHVACRTCGVAYEACTTQRGRRRGPCCDHCEHSRRAGR